MHNSQHLNPFDVWCAWYDQSSYKSWSKGGPMAEDTKQCKAMVTPVDGGEPYPCKLAVWQKHPKDGYCYMHHPKVTLRGGAARVAIDKGEVPPKTPKAKRRLKLSKRTKVKAKKPNAKNFFEDWDTRRWNISFKEHRIKFGKDAKHIVTDRHRAFDTQEAAEAFLTLLAKHDITNPVEEHDGLLYFSQGLGVPPSGS